MNIGAAADRRINGHAHRVLAAGGHSAQNIDVTVDGTSDADGPGVSAGDGDIAQVGQVADQVGLNRQAARVVALDRNGSRAFDQQVACACAGASDSDAVAIRARGDGTI